MQCLQTFLLYPLFVAVVHASLTTYTSKYRPHLIVHERHHLGLDLAGDCSMEILAKGLGCDAVTQAGSEESPSNKRTTAMTSTMSSGLTLPQQPSLETVCLDSADSMLRDTGDSMLREPMGVIPTEGTAPCVKQFRVKQISIALREREAILA
eukprot:gnl/TRDRNA2_/TRDRNA2_172162_c0_seq4.p1 gnl/TRDRNA2_/TRDRNA2_172162_c0~~gnl/TRDRNA2_/TRDRNA2_172162_c0_seq4.p1  ORF type:complete len:152 (+),score=6.65 gnl/TRDRNA2_/TRDRNA2_172162_c0_seq4:2-457(+)